jgi:hypothetical protein
MDYNFYCNKFKTDKGNELSNGNGYAEFYENWFFKIKESCSNILEIGLDNGGSLKANYEYFQNAQIIGLDILDKTVFENDRIKTFILDQGNLNELDVTQRPVHCTDKKRETMYIKDEDKWEKDENNSKIKKAIKRVASKNQRLLPKFKEAHPDCGTYHSKYSDQYNKIIIESVGGSGDNDAEKEEKIIRNISRNVVVEK